MVSNMQGNRQDSDAEIRLMGLILAQSALVGLAIGVYGESIILASRLTNGEQHAR